MFTEILNGFFENWQTWSIPAIGIFLAVCFGLSLILFFLGEVKKRTPKKKKFYSNTALFVLLLGLYGAFYIVKILFAQELGLRIW